MSQAPQTTVPARGGQRRGRWLLAALVLLALGLAAFGYYHYFGRTKPAVPIPEINLNGAESEVARVIERARGEVLRQPGSADAWGRLGEVLFANGHDAEAIPCLAQAERLDPHNPRWPYLQANRLLVMDRGSGIAPLRRAVELCDQVDPRNVAPRLLLIQTLIEKADYAEAKTHLQKVFERDADNPHAHFCMGLATLASGDVAGSRVHFLRAADSPYTRKMACAQLATVYQRLGEETRAEEFTRRQMAAPPDQPWNDPYVRDANRWTRGRQTRFLEAERFEREGRMMDAIRILAKVADDFPDGRSFVALGVALAKINDNEAAEPILRKAVSLAPNQINVRYSLAVVLLRQGENRKERGDVEAARSKFREAEATARKALELKPDHAFCHVYLGLALKHLGKMPEALASLRTAVRCRPELVDAHLRLGETLIEAGQRAAGLKCLKTAVELAPPEDHRPREALARLGDKKK